MNGAEPALADRFKSDVVILDGGGEAESLLHFRSFRGPFVFHCHTLEHEDLRMMLTVDPRETATRSPQPIQASFP
jgi:FtsP/CotA-like multicopper oxidase with cupredoxin domain